ncbi:MAG TPA: heavy-metal-associated domain-containing protein [Cytophagaceae bacterium]
MKAIILSIAISIAMLFACGSKKAEADQVISFKVTGNCDMCKKTIEGSLKDLNAVSSAVWNKETKIIEVAYVSAEISEVEIHNAIARSGYDTEKVKADDVAYEGLHSCCQYERTLHN